MASANDRPIIIGVGEVLWDCFEDSRRPGGAPANVAYHANQLGLRGVVCSGVGRDEDGDELLSYLRKHGLETRYIQRDQGHATGRVTVDASQVDQPRYTIHEDVAWDYVEFTDAWRDIFRRAAAVCFGTLAQRTPAARETIHAGLDVACEALRVYDVNLRPPFYERERIEESFERANIVKLNAEEVHTVAPMFHGAPGEPDAFGRWLHERFAVSLVCVTRGARGCLLVQGDRTADIPGREVRVVDAVGAGDAFTAAMIAARIRGWGLEQIGALANEVGALVASRAGAMPDVRREFEALLSRLEP